MCTSTPFVRRALAGLAAAATLAATSPATAQWRDEPSFPPGTNARAYPAGLRVGDALYAIGGMPFSGGDDDAAVHRLDVPGGTWITLPTVEGPIIRQGAGVDGLGRIVVFGGRNAFDPEEDAGRNFVYDDVEGQWNNIASRTAAAPDAHFAWATDDVGRLYSIGGGLGTSAHAGDPNVAHVERYDAIADTWTPIAAMPAGRADAAACFDATGRLLVIGGLDALGGQRLASVVAWDPGAGTWDAAAIPDLPEALSDHRALLGPDDRIYVLGGRSGPVPGGVTRAEVWVLSPGATAWTPGLPMSMPRESFAAMVGPDERIYVAGGLSNGVATPTVTSLETPACPLPVSHPDAQPAWAGQTLALSASFDSIVTPELQWTRDDVPLVDGPQPSGSTVSGATTGDLLVIDLAAADAGLYTLVATNPCGTVSSNPADIDVRTPDLLPRRWTVTNLHPGWALSSGAYATDGSVQLGDASVTIPEIGPVGQPVIWSGDAASAIQLTPPGSAGGRLLAGNAEVQVGWYWWPYGCGSHGQLTCYDRHGAKWNGSAASFEIMHSSGWEYSSVSDTDGVTHVGTLTDQDEVGNTFARAVRFNGGSSTTTLPGEGWPKTYASAIDGDRIYGSANTPNPGASTRAIMWPSVTTEPIVMHPDGGNRSWITAAGDGQQVGSVAFDGAPLPALWHGSPQGVRILATAGGSVGDCAGGFQVGSVAGHAVIWNGEPDLWFDLGAMLGADYASSLAHGLHVADDGTVTVVGAAYNAVAERTEAFMWRSGVAIIGDVDGNGVVDLADLISVLAAWGPCPAGPCAADVNGDGVVGFADLVLILSNWS